MKSDWTISMVRKEMELGRSLAEFIRERRGQGYAFSEIARELNVSRQTLQAWRKILRMRIMGQTKEPVDEGWALEQALARQFNEVTTTEKRDEE